MNPLARSACKHVAVALVFLSTLCSLLSAQTTIMQVGTLKGHTNDVVALAVSPDGGRVLSGSRDDGVILWDIGSGKAVWTFRSQDDTIVSVSISPDNKSALALSLGGTLCHLDLASGSELKRIKTGRGPIACSFMKGGQELVTVQGADVQDVPATRERKVWVASWDTKTGARLLMLEEPYAAYIGKDGGEVPTSACFSAIGNHVVIGSDRGWLYFFGRPEINPWEGKHGRVSALCISPDEKTLITAFSDGVISAGDVDAGAPANTIRRPGEVSAVAFLACPRAVLTLEQKTWMRLLRLEGGNPIAELELPGEATAMVLFPDETMIAVACGGDILLFQISVDLVTEIKEYVRPRLKTWQRKGEYEKTADYVVRMKERPQAVARLTVEAVNALKPQELKRIKWDQASLGSYDADHEAYPIDIPPVGRIIVPVQPDKAQALRAHWNNVQFRKPDVTIKEGKWVISSLEIWDPVAKRSTLYDSKMQVDYDPSADLGFDVESVQVDLQQEVAGAQGDDMERIDSTPPRCSTGNPNAIAVVIGCSKYTKASQVSFAINDAITIKKYLIQTLGYREGNIFFVPNASKGDFELYFGTREEHKGKLFNAIRAGETDVFIYYSGHGAPGLKDKKGYFVPVECDPNYIELQGYSLGVFYDNVAKLSARSTTIVLDACFSGAGVYENVSPIVISMNAPTKRLKNAVVISSSSGTQVSSWYKQKQHGLFTYFFLKAMHNRNADKNKDGKLTAQEIYDYVADKNEGVPYWARRIQGVEQDPVIEGDAREKVLVTY